MMMRQSLRRSFSRVVWGLGLILLCEGAREPLHAMARPGGGLFHAVHDMGRGVLDFGRGAYQIVSGPADILGGGLKMTSNPMAGLSGIFNGLGQTWTALPTLIWGGAQFVSGAGQIMCSIFALNSHVCTFSLGMVATWGGYQLHQSMSNLTIPADIQPCLDLSQQALMASWNATQQSLFSINPSETILQSVQCARSPTECVQNIIVGAGQGFQKTVNLTANVLTQGGECLAQTQHLGLNLVGYNWIGAGKTLRIAQTVLRDPYRIVESLKATVDAL